MATQKIVKIRIGQSHLSIDLDSVGLDESFGIEHSLPAHVLSKFCKLAGLAKAGGGWKKIRAYSTFSAPFSVVGYEK